MRNKPIITRLANEDVEALSEIQKLTNLSQSDAIRLAIQTTAKAYRDAVALFKSGDQRLVQNAIEINSISEVKK